MGDNRQWTIDLERDAAGGRRGVHVLALGPAGAAQLEGEARGGGGGGGRRAPHRARRQRARPAQQQAHAGARARQQQQQRRRQQQPQRRQQRRQLQVRLYLEWGMRRVSVEIT